MSDKEVRIRLKLDADSKELIVAEKDVKKLGTAVSSAAQQGQPLDGLFTKATKWGLGVIGVASAVGVLTAGFRRAVQAAEDWRLIEGKIDLVSDSTAQLLANQQALFSLSQETYQEFGNSATLYTRMANATKELDLQQQSLLDVTDLVNKSLVISSSTAAEQSSTITQLSQALASGVLRGEEFNAIMENGNRVAIALADGLGVTLGELRALAMEGELTAERVISALLSQKDAIDSEFARMPVRIEQSFTVLDNSITRFVGQADSAVGASQGIADAIRDISAAIDGVDLNDAANLATIDFIMATLSRTIDMFDLLYETAENGGQIAINGIADLMYGTLGTIAEMIRRAQEGLYAIGLSSNEAVQTAYELEIMLYEAAEKAQKSEKENQKEILDALRQANITIDERIALYRQERLHAEQSVSQQKESEKATLDIIDAVKDLDKHYQTIINLTGSDFDKFNLRLNEQLQQLIEAGYSLGDAYAYASKKTEEFWQAKLDASDTPEELVLGSGLKIDWGDETDTANEVFYGWGDTLNSSISNALVDALTGDDAMAAVEALVASMSASMIQSGVGTLATGDASGLIGIGAGVALSAIGGGLFGSSDSGPTWAERELDRIAEELERQTDILESNQALARALNQTGSAILSGLEMAGDTFVAAMESANIEFDEMFGLALGTYMDDDISGWSEGFTGKLKDYLSNLGVSQEDINSAFAESPLGGGDLLDMGAAQDLINTANDGASAFEMLQAAFDAGIISAEQYQPLLDDITLANEAYATALLENRDTVLSIAQSMSDLYEGITGEDLLGDQMLSDAQAQVSELMQNAGFDSFTDYIADLAMSAYEYGSQIEELSDQLQSEDPADQADAVAALSELTGVYFESTEDALNYMDAITLVGEAMVTSAANIATWQQRNESALETTQRLFSEMFPLDGTTLRSLSEGTQIAQTQEELDALFELLANDMDGLTDAELELLEANQAYIDQMEENTNSMLSWLDSLDGGARFLDEAMAQTGVTSIPSTIEDIQSLYQTFLDGDGIIDQYEQAILDAAAAQVSATEQMQASASDMYEDLYGEKTPAQEMMETMLAMQGQMFVDQFGGLQDVLAMLADGTLDLTEAQWAQVQALVEVEKSTSETADNTSEIVQNTRPDTPFVDQVLSDYRERKWAESILDQYGDMYGGIAEGEMEDIAALLEVFGEFDDILGGSGSYTSNVSRINDVLEALGLDSVSTAPDAGSVYDQLRQIFEAETGYTSAQASAISQLLEAMGILGDEALNAADALDDIDAEPLRAAQSSFAKTLDTALGFIDGQYANNTDYNGSLLRALLDEALGITDLIASGADYDQEDLDRLAASTSAASTSASRYLSTLDPNSYEYRIRQNVLAHEFGKISSEAAKNEKSFADVVSSIEAGNENSEELVSLSKLLIKAIQQLRKTTEEGLAA